MKVLVDGKSVGIGDVVCFKSDYEQTGRITRITTNLFGSTMLELFSATGFGGDYIGGENYTMEAARDCWVE